MTQPQLIIIGGANGSGKTTFASEIAAEFNLDTLARMMSLLLLIH